MQTFFAGAIMMASVVIAMYFWRFGRQTGDRLFGFFAVAFLLLGIERVAVAFLPQYPEYRMYLVRLTAFLLILFAILDKNRAERKR